VKILVSNDDGYFAPGIRALAEALTALGEVVIVAPDRNRSGASSSLTLTQPVSVTEHGDSVYGVDGSPADCVMVAMSGLLSWRPDVVVTGINDGPNMADDSLYSGTIAAAVEGRFLGLPSIAVSMAEAHPKHWHTAAQVAKELVENLATAPMPADTILNVNVPDRPYVQLSGMQITRLGTRFEPERAGEHISPRGQRQFWLGPAGEPDDQSAGSDFHAVANGFVSITRLTIDTTRHAVIPTLSDWLDGLQSLPEAAS
jgi:5'-nucleotidase